MKIRSDFVSNSSSCSFIIKDHNDIKKFINLCSKLDSPLNIGDSYDEITAYITLDNRANKEEIRNILGRIFDSATDECDGDIRTVEDKTKTQYVNYYIGCGDSGFSIPIHHLKYLNKSLIDNIASIDVDIGEDHQLHSTTLSPQLMFLLIMKICRISIDDSMSDRYCNPENIDFDSNEKFIEFVFKEAGK